MTAIIVQLPGLECRPTGGRGVIGRRREREPSTNAQYDEDVSHQQDDDDYDSDDDYKPGERSEQEMDNEKPDGETNPSTMTQHMQSSGDD
jgi:hypothetical protein